MLTTLQQRPRNQRPPVSHPVEELYHCGVRWSWAMACFVWDSLRSGLEKHAGPDTRQHGFVGKDNGVWKANRDRSVSICAFLFTPTLSKTLRGQKAKHLSQMGALHKASRFGVRTILILFCQLCIQPRNPEPGRQRPNRAESTGAWLEKRNVRSFQDAPQYDWLLFKLQGGLSSMWVFTRSTHQDSILPASV
ncbi:hypothetical protein ASPVEDRAFT_553206 [Aspergillus versicolor CBS 583.65]|uniref:Uncharacterized protein n=1 Tax=Aspergillus versicolor CBS 583.65 TaxID=1036611 RepID=A0A1L9PFF0_ASPVE|nr:uncharacterized protein ASPVEDRAFT_553206 [Aspergillus versicolor CBS 583.65]OJJ00192.1 hypothetical protein ASPVEDRAFT_553206 [Aspergillus versicolor CBS 583.65]